MANILKVVTECELKNVTKASKLKSDITSTKSAHIGEQLLSSLYR